jgi:hypothetical protein
MVLSILMNLKLYIHDKQINFLNLVLALLGLFNILLVVLRVDTTQSVAIIRNNTTLGLAGFEKARSTALYEFAFIALVIFSAHTVLAVRLREEKRAVSILSLGLGIVAMIFLIVVTTSVLSLHR